MGAILLTILNVVDFGMGVQDAVDAADGGGVDEPRCAGSGYGAV